jgi:hypothetical protein
MAYDPITRNLTDGQIVIKDGTTTPLSVTIDCDAGDLNIVTHKDRKVIMNRGTLDHVREGTQVPVDVSFTVYFSEFLTDETSSYTPYELLMQEGDASTAKSTRVDTAEAYCVDVEFTVTNPDADAAEKDELITISDFFVDDITFQEGNDFNTLAVKGRAMISKPTIAKLSRS